MMKRILILLGLFIGVSIHAQIDLDTVNNGSFAGAGDGEALYTSFQKVNSAITVLNNSVSIDTIAINYNTGSLTDGAPTSAEITAVLGTPSSYDAGVTFRIKDTDGTGLVYYLVTDGTNWYWSSLTQAL